MDLLTVDAELPGQEILLRAIDRVSDGGQLLLQDAGAIPMWNGKLRPGLIDGRLFEKCCPPVLIEELDRPADEEQLRTLARAQLERDLIEGYAALARSLARRFAHNRDTLPDLEQVAMVALVKAARGYDPTRSNSFSTYGTASILGELKRYFRDKTWMLRVPRSVQELYLEVKRARDELTQQLGALPTPAEIAAHLDVSERDVLNAISAGDNYAPASLDAGAEAGVVGRIPATETALDGFVDRDRLRSLLPELERRERLVLKRVYFDGCTQQEIAGELGVSQMQVSRILHRTLGKLRRSMDE